MTEKEKRMQRRKAEDAVFNRMLLFLLGAVVAEVVILLVKRAYMDIVSVGLATALYHIFGVLQYAGIVLVVLGVLWWIICSRKGKKIRLPAICTVVVTALWLIALLTYQLNEVGIRILMLLPAVIAVLILIYFLYQRAFFVSAILTGCGIFALWFYRRYYMGHPTTVVLCFVCGLVVLAVAALLAWKLSKTNGRIAGKAVMPEGSSYGICMLTCAVIAVTMILSLLLGAAVAYYLIFVLVGWLFCQAVFFTVKLM